MSPWTIGILLYLTIGIFASVKMAQIRRIGREKYGVGKPMSKAAHVVSSLILGILLWWFFLGAWLIYNLFYLKKLNTAAWNQLVEDALQKGSGNDIGALEALKDALLEKQRVAVAAGYPSEKVTVDMLVDKINRRIGRLQTGADFQDHLDKLAAATDK